MKSCTWDPCYVSVHSYCSVLRRLVKEIASGVEPEFENVKINDWIIGDQGVQEDYEKLHAMQCMVGYFAFNTNNSLFLCTAVG